MILMLQTWTKNIFYSSELDDNVFDGDPNCNDKDDTSFMLDSIYTNPKKKDEHCLASILKIHIKNLVLQSFNPPQIPSRIWCSWYWNYLWLSRVIPWQILFISPFKRITSLQAKYVNQIWFTPTSGEKILSFPCITCCRREIFIFTKIKSDKLAHRNSMESSLTVSFLFITDCISWFFTLEMYCFKLKKTQKTEIEENSAKTETESFSFESTATAEL